MKLAISIKTLKALCIAAMVALDAVCADAQTNFVFPAIGTVSNVTQYAVKNVYFASVLSAVFTTNGSTRPYVSTTWYAEGNPPTNKLQLDQQIIAVGLSNVIYSVCTNTDISIDKSKGVMTAVVYEESNGNYFSQPSLYSYNTFQLVKNGNGSYSVPDLSGFSTVLNDQIPFYVPNLQWARVEVGDKGDTYPSIEVDDELLDPASNPIGSDGFLYLNTDEITDSSSSSGDFWMKITLFDNGKFQIFNGDGNSLPETPMSLGMSGDGTNAFVTVNGGDSGLGFVIQSMTNLAKNAWSDCSPVAFVSPTNGTPTFFTIPMTNNCSFFRTATTNLPPT